MEQDGREIENQEFKVRQTRKKMAKAGRRKIEHVETLQKKKKISRCMKLQARKRKQHNTVEEEGFDNSECTHGTTPSILGDDIY